VYFRYAPVFVTCVAENPSMFAMDAEPPVVPSADVHESVDRISLTRFVEAKVRPDIWIVHPVVNVHFVVPVTAPFIVNAPTMYE
jgi:hypothetical protein